MESERPPEEPHPDEPTSDDETLSDYDDQDEDEVGEPLPADDTVPQEGTTPSKDSKRDA